MDQDTKAALLAILTALASLEKNQIILAGAIKTLADEIDKVQGQLKMVESWVGVPSETL